MLSLLMLTCSAWIDDFACFVRDVSEYLWDGFDVDGAANHGGRLQGF